MTVYSEENLPFAFGQGLDLYNHPARLAPGYSVEAKNFIAKGDRLDSRPSLIPPIDYSSYSVSSGYIDTTSASSNLYYSHLPDSEDVGFPVGIWAGPSDQFWAIRGYETNSPDYALPWVRSFTHSNGQFYGACLYLDKLYMNLGGKIYEASAFNWTAGTLTLTLVPDTTGFTNPRGLIVFKDRMWTWDGKKIFYTEVPTAPGLYPTDWDTGNFTVLGAGAGMGVIHNIIPMGTSLFVFTSNGLYSISVIGSPINWVHRTIDSAVRVNTYNCAFEYQGLIFFVDVRGVWATDGTRPREISKNIRPVFEFGIDPTRYKFSIVRLADGILFSKSFYGGGSELPISQAKVYYTEIENILWTEWDTETVTDIQGVIGGFAHISTYQQFSPNSYVVLLQGDGAAGLSFVGELKLVSYDSPQDIFIVNFGAGAVADAAFIKAEAVSQINVFRLLEDKRGTYGYLNISTDQTDVATNIAYRWNTNHADSAVTGTVVSPVGAEGLVKITGPGMFRHLQLELDMTTTATVSKYSLLGVSMNIQSHRKTPDRAS